MWSLLSCNLSNLVPLYLIFHNRYCHSVRQQLFQWRNNLEYRWPTGFYSWSYISPGLCERVFRKWQLHRLYLVWECWVGSIVEFLTSKSFIIFFLLNASNHNFSISQIWLCTIINMQYTEFCLNLCFLIKCTLFQWWWHHTFQKRLHIVCNPGGWIWMFRLH